MTALYVGLIALGLADCLAPLIAHLIGGPVPPARDLAQLSPIAAFLLSAWAYRARPDNRAVGRLLAMAVALLTAMALGHVLSAFYLRYGLPDWAWLANSVDLLLQQASGMTLVALLAVFPDGKYQRPYERWVVWIVAVGAVLVVPLILIASPSIPSDGIFLWSGFQPTSPLHIASAVRLQPGLPLPLAYIVGVVVLGLRAFRFRKSGPDLRWVMLVVSLFSLLPVANGLVLLRLLSPNVSAVLFLVIFPLVTASLAIALVRFHLFDVELVIRRSIVYGLTWTAIAVVYAALAAGFGLATALRFQVAIAILVAITATIAFQPARGWLEHLADRLIYGRRLEAYQVVKRIGAAFDQTIELEAVGPHLAQAVADGLGASWVDVYVGREGAGGATFEKVGRSGPLEARGQPAFAQPLTHAGELVGKIEVGPASAGEYRAQDRELLLAIGQQAALAIRNARLAAELAASRARIVQAQEAERRRVERDLHDGIQQQLVSLMAGIRAARTQVSRDPAQAEARLAAVQEEAQQALKDLRRVVAGIHPAVLTDHGLATAVRARISRLPIDVEFECPEALSGQRFAEDVESAANFLISEGLTNVLKHSGSMAAHVRLGTANGHLRIEIRDGGRGFNVKDAPASGLQGLRDRVEALGGRLMIDSSPGAGTSLVATLKIREASHA